MKRVLVALLCVLFVLCGVLVACDDGGEGAHVHTYKTTWTKDVSGHWYDPTCECVDAPKVVLNHSDANNDGACDVCTYTDHEHTYSETYTADCTNHWFAADCGHVVPGVQIEAHADGDGDGICDDCKYVIEDLHNHIYATEWTNDGEYHWHAALCEHQVEVADKAAHNLNDAGFCTVCDAQIVEIDETDIVAVLKAAIANNYKIVTGDIKHDQIVYNGVGEAGTPNQATDGVYFVLGNDQSYVFMKDYNASGTLTGGEQQWFEKIGEEIFGVKMDVNAYTLDRVDGVPAKLNGYNYMPGDILMAGYEDTSTLAQTLYNFYDRMVNGKNVSGATTNYDAKTGKYSFSYTAYDVNEYTSGGVVYDRSIFLYEVEVEFTMNADLIIETANFQSKQYAYTNGGETENDLAYNEETGEVTKTASANPTYYAYEVFQTSGERTFTTPYPKASLIPVGFNFYHVETHEFVTQTDWRIYEESLVGDTLSIPSGTYTYFHLDDPIPTTASFNFVDTSDFTFTFVNNNPDSTARAWYMDPGSTDAMLNTYSGNIGCLKLLLRDPGSYTVTIKLGNITKVFTLTVEGEPKAEISATEDSISVLLSDFYTYENEDQSYTFTATEEGNYTFTIPAGLGVRVDGEVEPRVDLYALNGGAFTVGLNAGESVKLYFATHDATKYTATISFEAADIPDPEIGGGDTPTIPETALQYSTDEGSFAVNSTNAAPGAFTYTAAADATLTVKYALVMGAAGDTVSYSINGGTAVALEGDNVETVINLVAGDVIVITINSNGYASLHANIATEGGATPSIEASDLVYSTTEGEFAVNSTNAAPGAFTYTAAADATLTVKYALVMGAAGDTVSYSINGGTAVALEGDNVETVINLVAGDVIVITINSNGYASLHANIATTATGGDEGGNEGGDEPTETLNATYYAYTEGQTILTVAFSDDGTVVFSYLHPMNPSSLTANYTISNGAVTLTDTETGDTLPQLAAYVTLTSGVPTLAGYSGYEYDLYAEGETPSVETPEEVELSKGDNTVPVTGTDVMTNVTITSEGAGVYYITVGTNAVVLEGWSTYVAGDVITVYANAADETYTYEVNSEDYTAGTVNLNVEFVAKAADEPAKDALVGEYKSGDYIVSLSRVYGTGVYIVTVYNADNSVNLQFTYTLTDNGDNSYTLSDLVNVPNEYGDAGTDKIDEIVASGITFSIDPVKEDLTDDYFTVDNYNVSIIKAAGEYYITISDADYNAFYYFTYTVTDNGNGTLTLNQTNVENSNAYDQTADTAATLAAMEALEIVVNYDVEKEALRGTHEDLIDGYIVTFYKSEGAYYANVYTEDYATNLYFTFEVDAGVNGAKNVTLTYFANPDFETGTETQANEIAANAIVIGGLEGEGTYESPYVIEETGDYVSPYAGGYEYPYFQFTAPANGYVTISSTYANLNLQYGKVIDTPNNNMSADGMSYLNEIKIYLLEGATVYFNVADNTFPEDAVNVPFTISFEEFESEDPSFLEGEWNGTQSTMYSTTPYTFIFNDDGTGSGSYTDWSGSVAFTINYTLVDGNTVVVNFTTSGWSAQEFDMTFTYDSESDTLTGDAEFIKAKKLEAGSVQINATNDKYVYYATEEIVFNLNVGASVMSGNVTVTYYVNGEEVKSLTFNENADVTLASGDQLLVVITADTYSSLTVARVYPEGSEQNPTAIETLPYEIAVNGNHDVYYTYTATEDIVLTITAPAGCYVTNSKDVTGVDGVYTITLTAGESVTLNAWTTAADEIDYTYKITGAAPEVEEGGDDEGGSGSESTGVDGTYVGSFNGRGMRVVIDTAADTMVITRASSGSMTAFDGQASYTYTYSATVENVANGAAISTADGGYSPITAIEFDENGNVTSVVWNGGSYADFAKQ